MLFGLNDLPGVAFAFVMVLARAGSVVMFLPGVGEAEVPVMIRAGFALALTLLFLPVAGDGLALPAAGTIAAAAMVGCEVVTGLWIRDRCPIYGPFFVAGWPGRNSGGYERVNKAERTNCSLREGDDDERTGLL